MTDVLRITQETILRSYRKVNGNIVAPNRLEMSPAFRDEYKRCLETVERIKADPPFEPTPPPDDISGLEYVSTLDGTHIYCNPAFAWGVVAIAKTE